MTPLSASIVERGVFYAPAIPRIRRHFQSGSLLQGVNKGRAASLIVCYQNEFALSHSYA